MPLSALALVACGGSPNSSETIESEPTVEQLTDRGAVLSLACSGCHSNETGAIVSLTSYDPGQMQSALNRYRSEADGTTVMHRLARGYTDSDIDLIIAHFEQVEAD